MNKSNQIKTHFDGKVILFFFIIFIVACGLLAFKINTKEVCTVKDFKIDAPSFKSGELITFSDNTLNASEWRWYFGDGSKISYRSKVAHSFSKPGKYTIKLLVNNSCTVEKTITIVEKNEVVDESLLPKFTGPAFAYVGEPVAFIDTTAHAKSWEWRFGDGSKIDAIDKNPTYTYRTAGEKAVTLVINGDMKYFAQRKITVLPARKEQKDLVAERLARRSNARGDVVNDYFNSLPDAPGRSPEFAGLNEEKFKGILNGICKDELSYDNVKRYFCEDDLPLIKLRNDKTISLKQLDTEIRNRNINVKKIQFQKDQDGCITLINLNYRYKTIF
ncbi:PKD domain-containing protein [Flavobacterium qiangtangense]|uniref:PKD domain-containing protein n=1 Tax=Flavobacterium qiangtangense TaxID=1442595 RepID=A0ABW1PS44_9FLAO